MNTINCKYSCALCGLIKVTVAVTAREAEPIVRWMEDVCVPAIMRDHKRRSPHCHPTKLSNIMIPVSGDTIGGAVIQ